MPNQDIPNNDPNHRTQASQVRHREKESKSAYDRDYNVRRNPPVSDDLRGTEKGFFGKGPKGWTRSDERIKEEVSEALYRNHRVDASEIEVDVKEGIVTLSGTVDSRQSKKSAEECIENLSGVIDVHNRIQIQQNINESIDEKRSLS